MINAEINIYQDTPNNIADDNSNTVSPDISFNNKPNKAATIHNTFQYFEPDQIELLENKDGGDGNYIEKEENKEKEEEEIKDTSPKNKFKRLDSPLGIQTFIGQQIKRPKLRKLLASNEFLSNIVQYDDLAKGINSNKLNQQFQKPINIDKTIEKNYSKRITVPSSLTIPTNNNNEMSHNRTVEINLNNINNTNNANNANNANNLQNGMDKNLDEDNNARYNDETENGEFSLLKFRKKNKMILSVDIPQEGAYGKLSLSKGEKRKSIDNIILRKSIVLKDSEFVNLKESRELFGKNKTLLPYFKLKEEQIEINTSLLITDLIKRDRDSILL